MTCQVLIKFYLHVTNIAVVLHRLSQIQGKKDHYFRHTVNDLFSAQCAKERLLFMQYLLGKNSPFSAPIMKHFPG